MLARMPSLKIPGHFATRGLLLAGLCWLAPAAMAITFEPVGTDRGLDAQVISSVLVDQQGFLWVGSREGLFRYDGYRAIRFTPEPGNPDSITDADIRMVYEAPDGIIWVATNSGGLNRFDPATGRFNAFRHESGRSDSISNDSVYGMAQAGSDKLWVGTQAGLNLLDTTDGTARRFLHDPADNTSLSHDYVFAIHGDQDGNTWITTNGGGVNRWNESLQAFDRFDFAEALNHKGFNDVFSVAETPDGVLWFGTRHGLVRLDPADGSMRQVDLLDDEGSDHTITSSVMDDRGRIWMTALAAGVLIFDPISGETELAQSRPMGNRGQLPAVPQLALALTGDLLFVGTWGSGVYSGRIQEPDYRLLTFERESDGLQFQSVMAILPGEEEGTPWVGNFGGGMLQIDISANSALPPLEVSEPLEDIAVFSIVRVSDGGLLVATPAGLWVLSSDLLTTQLYPNNSGQNGGLGDGHVTRVLEDTENGFWVGMGGSGVYHLAPGSEVFEVFRHEPGNPESLADDYITALLQTEAGAIWVGTRSAGLNYCTLKPWRCRQFSADTAEPLNLGHFHVTDIFEDREGGLWVTTDGGGLHRALFSAEGEVEGFRRWTRHDGLVSDAAVAMVQDDDGTLWISTREGISRFEYSSNAFENYVAAAGLPVSHFNVGAAARDQSFLYFGSVDGLLSIPAGSEFQVRQPSPVSLTYVEQTSEAGTGLISLGHADMQTIPFGEVMSVGFAVLDFSEVPHSYEYQLDGASEWIGLGSKRDVTFFGLSPGYHELKTRGRDVFGTWNEAPPFRLNVIPPFWMTSWFRGLVVVSLAVLVLLAHLARTAALRRRNAALQQLQNEREQALASAQESQAMFKDAYDGLRNLTRRLESVKEEERQSISRELHDELGQLLTAAKLNLQMAKKNSAESEVISRLDDAVVMIDHMIQQVRDISLNLRPPLLDEAGLAAALEVYLDQMEDRSGTTIRLSVASDVSGNPPEVRIIAFRVVQEAVNNALKHAGANQIEVTLWVENGSLWIRISDDGRGFNQDEIDQRVRRGEHLGLLGMGERLDAVGGTIKVESSPGKGSKIEVSIPR